MAPSKEGCQSTPLLLSQQYTCGLTEYLLSNLCPRSSRSSSQREGNKKPYALPLPSDNERSFGGHIGDFNTPPVLPCRILECFGSRISVLPHAELCMVPGPVHGPVLPELRFRDRTAAPEQECTHQHQQKPSFHFEHPSFLSPRER